MGKGWLFGSDPSVIKPPVRRMPDPLFLNPGQMDQTINIAKVSATQDQFGQPVQTWTTYLECYCKILMLSGQQLYQGEQFTSASQYEMKIWWPGETNTINVGDRVFLGARVFVIQIVDNVKMRNVVVRLICLEIDGSS